MRNKFQLLLILLTIIIISFPSICFSELKTVQGEYCEIYLGDMKNKKELNKFRKFVREESIREGVFKLTDPLKFRFTEKCFSHVISNYLEKVVVVSHTENGRKICDKVKITSDPEVINTYLSQEFCIIQTRDILDEMGEDWTYNINDVLRKKSEKINIGLIIETKIPDLDEHKKEILENEEESQFHGMIDFNKDKYKVVDRKHLNRISEEQKLSSSGITESETVKLGKILSLDIIVLRMIYEGSRTTKVLKVDTGEVLLFKTYETKSKSVWEPFVKMSDDVIFYYNKTNLNKSYDKLSVWTYETVSDDGRKELIELLKKDGYFKKSIKYQNYDHIIHLWEIDCKDRKWTVKENITYDYKGNILEHINYNPDWKNIIPGTPVDFLYEKFCLSH